MKKSLRFIDTLNSLNEKSYDFLHIFPEESLFDYDAMKIIAENSSKSFKLGFTNNIFSNYIDDNCVVIKEFRVSKELYGICILTVEPPDNAKWFTVPFFTLGFAKMDEYLGEINVKKKLNISLFDPTTQLQFYPVPNFFKIKTKENIKLFILHMKEKIKKIPHKLINLKTSKYKIYKIISSHDWKDSYIKKESNLGFYVEIKSLNK